MSMSLAFKRSLQHKHLTHGGALVPDTAVSATQVLSQRGPARLGRGNNRHNECTPTLYHLPWQLACSATLGVVAAACETAVATAKRHTLAVDDPTSAPASTPSAVSHGPATAVATVGQVRPSRSKRLLPSPSTPWSTSPSCADAPKIPQRRPSRTWLPASWPDPHC